MGWLTSLMVSCSHQLKLLWCDDFVLHFSVALHLGCLKGLNVVEAPFHNVWADHARGWCVCRLLHVGVCIRECCAALWITIIFVIPAVGLNPRLSDGNLFIFGLHCRGAADHAGYRRYLRKNHCLQPEKCYHRRTTSRSIPGAEL